MLKVRHLIQLGFVVLAAWLGLRHQIVGGGPQGVPPIDSYCLFGAIETLPSLVSGGSYLMKTAPSNLWLLLALIITTLLFGAVFCGWICPLGSLSEWLYRLREKFYPQKLILPPALDQILGYSKYLFFLLIIYMTINAKRLWFEEFDPYKKIFHMNVEDFSSAMVILFFILISLAIERAWCRYLCPLSVIINPLSKLSFLKINRKDNCINCHKCDRTCPTAIKIASQPTDSGQCIRCNRCTEACPVQALEFKTRFGNWQTSKTLAVMLSAVLLFGTIILTVQHTPYWQAKTPNMITGKNVTSTEDIRGWMNLDQALTALKVDKTKLMQELKLPANTETNMTVKQFRAQHDISETKLAEIIRKLLPKK